MWNEVSSQPAVWQDLFNYYQTLTIGGGMCLFVFFISFIMLTLILRFERGFTMGRHSPISFI